ncbi:MAG: DUF86 domain-containing protein [Planctomycetes bacterium]|nr:DUF86 domain-containing protein [Planctomycetota bacterium]
MSSLRDPALLLDILVAARRAQDHVGGLDWHQFAASTLHQDALLRALEVIGEAARQVSRRTQSAHPEIPWVEMVAMRNRLIHGYAQVDLRRVWETVKRDLPALLTAIEPLVPQGPVA